MGGKEKGVLTAFLPPHCRRARGNSLPADGREEEEEKKGGKAR